MATQTTQIAFPPLDSQSTTSLIEANVAEGARTGDIQTDFKKALISLLGLSGSGYSLDDLWKRYQLSSTVTGDADVQGPPSRTPPGHGGQHPHHFLPPGRLKNVDNATPFPGVSTGPTYALPELDSLTLAGTSTAGNTNLYAFSGFIEPNAGEIFYTIDELDEKIYPHTLTTPYDITTLQTAGTPSTNAFTNPAIGVTFSYDGNHILYGEYSTNKLYIRALSTQWDATSFGAANDTSLTENAPYCCFMETGGSAVTVMDGNIDRLKRYTLSTPYDLSTASLASNSSGVITSNVRSFIYDDTGTRVWTMDQTTKTCYQYTLSTPFDMSTISADGVTLSIASTLTPTSISWANNSLYVNYYNVIAGTQIVRQYS